MMLSTKSEQRKLANRLILKFAVIILIFGLAYFFSGLLPESGLRFNNKDATSLFNCLYFSVVTITTLGFGDLTPIGVARILASTEAVFGLVYVGYAISQVVSYKQEGLIDYLANDRIIQTFDLCLADVSDAKEVIADRRRAIQAGHIIEVREFIYYRGNPFYPVSRAMRALLGYTIHIETIGKMHEMSERIERAAHHVEEIAGFTRKLINIMNNEGIAWKTDRVVMLITEVCELIDSFATRFVRHTRYSKIPYKGKILYKDLVSKITKDIRTALIGETVRYRPHINKGLKTRRISRVSFPSGFKVKNTSSMHKKAHDRTRTDEPT